MTAAADRQRRHRASRCVRRGTPAAGREALGPALAEHIGDPDCFAAALARRPRAAWPTRTTWRRAAAHRARASASIHGVRWPLLGAIERGFRSATAATNVTSLLFIADRLFREPELEARWFAFGLLDARSSATTRSGPGSSCGAPPATPATGSPSTPSPTRTGSGILREPYRWAELEQLVFTRRAGSGASSARTIATMSVRATAARSRPRRSPSTALAARSRDLDRATPSRTSRRRSRGPIRSLAPSTGRRGRRRSAGEADRAVATQRRPSGVGHPRHPVQARPASRPTIRALASPGIRKRPGRAVDLASRAADRAAPLGRRCPTRTLPPRHRPHRVVTQE